MKTCNKCWESKPLTEFYKGSLSPDGYYYECKKCNNARSKQHYKDKQVYSKDKERRQALQFEKLYGISTDTYAALLEKQEGKCAACGKGETTVQNGRVRKLSLDHEHATGKIRGLLCQKCNHAVGLLKEDPALMRRLASYVEVADTGLRLGAQAGIHQQHYRSNKLQKIGVEEVNSMIDELSKL